MTAAESQLTAKVALLNEAEVLRRVAERVDTESFNEAVGLLRPLVGFTGVGKSGHVARRAAASFSSVGLAACYVDANEALHGDLGLLRTCSVLIAISNSGNTREVIVTIDGLGGSHPGGAMPIIAITRNHKDAELALCGDVVLDSELPREVDPTSLVPTASLVAQSAWCDALMIAWMHRQGITPRDFKNNHPGGTIGAG